MASSSVPLILGDCLESWTFCTTLRYVFFDLENCLVEVRPYDNPYFSKWGYWRLFYLSFQLLIFIIPSNKMPQFSLFAKILYLLLQVIVLVCVMLMIPMEVAIFVFIVPVGISLHLLLPLQGEVIFDLHKYLIKWSIQGCVVLAPSWRRTRFPVVSILLFSCSGLL